LACFLLDYDRQTLAGVFRRAHWSTSRGDVMKIHMRPPLLFALPAPPPKAPPTLFQLEVQTEELITTAQQQRDRLKKLHGARKNPGDLNDDGDSETQERDHRSNRNFDFIA
jgi:hypothetical protein